LASLLSNFGRNFGYEQTASINLVLQWSCRRTVTHVY
jgi:hypothetical protein